MPTTAPALTTSELSELRQLAELRDELQAYRDGRNQLTVDPMHAGQPIVEIYEYAEGESSWWLQETHQDLPIFSCMVCCQVTLGRVSGGKVVRPNGCTKCGTDHTDDLTPHLYEQKAACRSWSANYGGQYEGACLIAGSDGCECPEATA